MSIVISILIPCFNSENTIINTLESIPKLSIIEVVVVDDGSTDNSKSLIIDYSAKSKLNCKLIVSDNRGPSNARNLALQNSIGDWIIFLDSDDKVEANTIISFLEKIQYKRNIDGERFKFENASGKPAKNNYASNKLVLLQHMAWHRYIYNRKFLVENSIHFIPNLIEYKEIYMFEDYYFLLIFLAFKPNLEFSNTVLLLYKDRQSTYNEIYRYQQSLYQEHKILRIFRKQFLNLEGFDAQFLMTAIYFRVSKICLLLNPRPRLVFRLQLLFQFFLIGLKLRSTRILLYLAKIFFKSFWLNINKA